MKKYFVRPLLLLLPAWIIMFDVKLLSIIRRKVENLMIILSANSLNKLDLCKNCTSKTKDVNLILQMDKYLVYKSYCTDCFNGETVYKRCSIKGQTETNPCLKACDYCLQNYFYCIRRAALVINVDFQPDNN